MHFLFFQAEDGILDLVRSRGLGDVYKRQPQDGFTDGDAGLQLAAKIDIRCFAEDAGNRELLSVGVMSGKRCLLYTSDAADERSSVDLGGRRIIKKKKTGNLAGCQNGSTKSSQQ